MVISPSKPLTLEAFLALPEGETGYELVDGQVIPKMAPKWLHAKSTGSLYRIFDAWSQNRGRVGIEWAITLRRRGKDWVPTPDLLYISCDRLTADWEEDAPCPVAPELAIEIISTDQTFGQTAQKATDYLAAGVSRVWIVDPRAASITVFLPDAPPITYSGDTEISDPILPELRLTAAQVFD
ncbi:MAG: Uma2 family endonuclease [Chloroflexaceae bacterium]|nr:Uma2 family endonuclease [Chloroflexaceae bacterium]